MERSCPNCGTDIGSATDCPSCGATVGTDVVWECVECGRIHQKHAPPCSRCGTPTLERTHPTYDLPETQSVSYRDVFDREHLAVVGVVAVLVAITSLGAFGVIEPPGAELARAPATIDAPGQHSELAGTDIDRIETAWLWTLDDRRSAANRTTLDRSESLGQIAAAVAHLDVRSDHRPEETTDPETVVQADDLACTGPIHIYNQTVDRASLGDQTTPRAIAGQLQFDSTQPRQRPRALTATLGSVHVHVGPTGSIYVAAAFCSI